MQKDGTDFEVAVYRAEGLASGTAADGAILSPMPGRIIAVEVAAGERVMKGQKLVTLEAMKMEHSLVAPFDGTVAELDASAGAQVSEGSCWRGWNGRGERQRKLTVTPALCRGPTRPRVLTYSGGGDGTSGPTPPPNATSADGWTAAQGRGDGAPWATALTP